jgi:hypothetical protein
MFEANNACRTAMMGAVVAGAAVACSSCSALGQFTSFNQTGQAMVMGDNGMVMDFPQQFTPFSTAIASGGGADGWTGQSALSSQWTSNIVRIQSTSAIIPGMLPAVVTQGMGMITIDFQVTAPTAVNINFVVGDFVGIPPPPMDDLTIMFMNMSTSTTIAEGAGAMSNVGLIPGMYRLMMENNLGNMPGELELSNAHGRTVDATISVVPSAGVLGGLGFGMVLAGRRRR